MKKVIVIGGGLAGLVCAIQLAIKGIGCTVIEKKRFPFHRVCGEYISNECVPYLKSLGAYPEIFHPPVISRLQLSSINGESAFAGLEMGGFGISRYQFDNFLVEKAQALGVRVLNDEVEQIDFSDEKFYLKATHTNIECDVIIGAFGKRSKLDIQLNRGFIRRRSPYVGVKYHVRTEHAEKLISLHNFNGGYCGIVNIEEGKTNYCYLTHRDNVKEYGSISSMEEHVLFKNPLIKNAFQNADFLFEKPEVINEISFEKKAPVEQHILMVGDAAGMIAPLCGNGMAMAIRAGKIAATLTSDFAANKISRSQLENLYAKQWNKLFARRLWLGRQVQRFFGHSIASDIAVKLMRSRAVSRVVIAQTHGEIFYS